MLTLTVNCFLHPRQSHSLRVLMKWFFSDAAPRTETLPSGQRRDHGIFKGAFRIGEVDDGFLESSWRLHETIYADLFAYIKYIFTPLTR